MAEKETIEYLERRIRALHLQFKAAKGADKDRILNQITKIRERITSARERRINLTGDRLNPEKGRLWGRVRRPKP